MRELICITCPRGCHLVVDDNKNVTGNFCPRGVTYAISEVTHPVRVVTSTVKLTNSVYPRVSVKTKDPIPKSKIGAVMEEINRVSLKAPVKIGDIAIQNVLNLGVDVVVTKNIDK
ncbi:MAG: DUF1667 domain-containing protein [Bacilli bacterium]|nr:DUF1667 domain-containing protein [Bacilli bacterium]